VILLTIDIVSCIHVYTSSCFGSLGKKGLLSSGEVVRGCTEPMQVV
jgi:hypothetical protein